MKLIDVLNKMKIKDLKKEISSQNIKGYSKLKKNELVKLMINREDRFKYLLLNNMNQKKELLEDKIKLKEAKDKMKNIINKKILIKSNLHIVTKQDIDDIKRINKKNDSIDDDDYSYLGITNEQADDITYGKKKAILVKATKKTRTPLQAKVIKPVKKTPMMATIKKAEVLPKEKDLTVIKNLIQNKRGKNKKKRSANKPLTKLKKQDTRILEINYFKRLAHKFIKNPTHDDYDELRFILSPDSFRIDTIYNNSKINPAFYENKGLNKRGELMDVLNDVTFDQLTEDMQIFEDKNIPEDKWFFDGFHGHGLWLMDRPVDATGEKYKIANNEFRINTLNKEKIKIEKELKSRTIDKDERDDLKDELEKVNDELDFIAFQTKQDIIEGIKPEVKKPEVKKPEVKAEVKPEVKNDLSDDEKELEKLNKKQINLENRLSSIKPNNFNKDTSNLIQSTQKELLEVKLSIYELKDKMKGKDEKEFNNKDKGNIKEFEKLVKKFIKKPTKQLLDDIDQKFELVEDLDDEIAEELEFQIDKFEKGQKKNKKKKLK